MNDDKKITRLAVRAIICDENNRVLIIKRTNTNYGQNKWCLPGGKVDFGISVEMNLAKELEEETTLQCLNSEFLFFLETLPSPESDMHFVSLVFRCEVVGKVLLNDESNEFAWITRKQMEEYAFAFDNDKALEWFWETKMKIMNK